MTAGRLAHLVTLEPDGRPQVNLVWVGLDGDQIVSGHMQACRKVENLRRDPRVALSIEAEGRSKQGLDHYLVYLGPGVIFPPVDDPSVGYVVRITPERIGGVGPWAS